MFWCHSDGRAAILSPTYTELSEELLCFTSASYYMLQNYTNIIHTGKDILRLKSTTGTTALL